MALLRSCRLLVPLTGAAGWSRPVHLDAAGAVGLLHAARVHGGGGGTGAGRAADRVPPGPRRDQAQREGAGRTHHHEARAVKYWLHYYSSLSSRTVIKSPVLCPKLPMTMTLAAPRASLLCLHTHCSLLPAPSAPRPLARRPAHLPQPHLPQWQLHGLAHHRPHPLPPLHMQHQRRGA